MWSSEQWATTVWQWSLLIFPHLNQKHSVNGFLWHFSTRMIDPRRHNYYIPKIFQDFLEPQFLQFFKELLHFLTLSFVCPSTYLSECRNWKWPRDAIKNYSGAPPLWRPLAPVPSQLLVAFGALFVAATAAHPFTRVSKWWTATEELTWKSSNPFPTWIILSSVSIRETSKQYHLVSFGQNYSV